MEHNTKACAPVHPSQSTNVGEYILDGISELEGIHVAKPELNVRVNHELCESNDFTTKMEGIPEARLLSLLGRESLNRLQVHVLGGKDVKR